MATAVMQSKTGLNMGTTMVHEPLTCSCGQALDCCHTGHCPRCGVTLHSHH
jgi:hypothetical protein